MATGSAPGLPAITNCVNYPRPTNGIFVAMMV